MNGRALLESALTEAIAAPEGPVDPEREYERSKERSRAADERLGFRKEEIERALIAGAQARAEPAREQKWIGLPLASLETPYAELIEALRVAIEGVHAPRIADLGAAYGRVGLAAQWLCPGSTFIGVELVAERVREAERIFGSLGLADRCRMDLRDLGAPGVALPPADIYFLYDTGTVERIRALLEELRTVAARGGRPIVIGRGRTTRNLIEQKHPWLSQVREPRHFRNLSVYFAG